MGNGEKTPAVIQDSPPLGIAFLGGEGPAPDMVRNLIKHIPPRRGLILAAADSGLVLAETAGFRPRWIVGDMDSLDPRRLAPYPAEAVHAYPKDKDFTDTELAVSLLWEQGCGEIWLIGGGGGRTDHLFALRSLFEREKPPSRWLTAAEDIRCLQSPGILEYHSGGGVGFSSISVFPLDTGPWQAESTGLKWPLAGLPWDRGFFGLSNEAPEGECTIMAVQGRFMVILPIRYTEELEEGGSAIKKAGLWQSS